MKNKIPIAAIIFSLAFLPFYFAHIVALADIKSDPASLKISVQKGKSITLDTFLKSNSEIKVTPKVSDLLEENAKAVIPSNYSAVTPSQITLKTELLQIQYKLDVPKEQASGVYTGKIILDQNGSTTDIPLQITVVSTPDYFLVLYWILGGASVSVVWTALNDYNKGTTSTPITIPPKGGKIDRSAMNHAIFRGLATGVGAILAAMLTYNQFLQTNTNFADQVFGGVFIAFAWGFGAHQILDNVIDEASQALKKSH
jgi:KaiC/GvpD/RAD55 family RecA-like ATPase